MTAYVIFNSTIKDMDKLKEYSASAGKIVAQHGGKFLAKGPAEILCGEAEHKLVVLLEFDSLDVAKGFYHSDEYQALIPIRDQGMDVIVQLCGE